MMVTVDLGPVRVVARYCPAVRGRRSGHPDNWTPDEPEEIEIVRVVGVVGEPDCENFTDDDIRSAVRDEVERTRAGWFDGWLARRELTE